jgi:hypothetical protein
MTEGMLNCRGYTDYKLSVKAGFVYNEAPKTNVVLRMEIKGMLCI